MKQVRLLNDQLSLSYVDIGDPNGFPVLVQHGMIASIRDTHLFARLVERGVRVLSIARPGYGESTPYTMKNMAGWGEIVRLVVDALGIDRLDVFGISSGAPYAYSIGRALPERVRNIYILSGIPALFDETVQSLWPYPLNREASLPDLQSLAHDLFFAGLPPESQEQADIQDSMRNACFGPAQDLKIRCADWGFRLDEVKCPVRMRQSLAEGPAALAMAKRTASLLPNCQVILRENDPHFSQEVLDDFITSSFITSRSAPG